MDVEEIVKEWLRQHGYDGLANDECGCHLEDFAPCGEMGMGCCPAMQRLPTDAERDDADFIMDSTLPPREKRYTGGQP